MKPYPGRLSILTEHRFLTPLIIYFLVFVAMPAPFEHFFGSYREIDDHFWDVVSAQVNGTYRSQDYPESSHAAKLTFRLVPVWIGKLSFSSDKYIQVLVIYCVQVLMGLGFTILFFRWLRTIIPDGRYVALLVLGFLMSHVGSSFTYDFSFFFDGIAFFFLGLALFTRSPVLFVLGLSGALWTDERAIIGIAGVLLFKLISDGNPGGGIRAILNRHSFLTLAVIAVYIGIRLWLGASRGMTIPLGDGAAVGFKAWLEQMNQMPLAWLLTFKLSWYYLLPLTVFLWRENILLGVLTVAFVAVAVLATGMVEDIMRSTSYLFPFLLCGIFCAQSVWRSEENHWAVRFVSIANVVIPNYRNFHFFYLILPLPFRIIRALF